MSQIINFRQLSSSDEVWRALHYYPWGNLSEAEVSSIGAEAGFNIFDHDNSAKDAINEMLYHGGAGHLPNMAYSANIYKLGEVDALYWSKATAENLANMSMNNWRYSPPEKIALIPPQSMAQLSAAVVDQMSLYFSQGSMDWAFLSRAQVAHLGANFAQQNHEAVKILNAYRASSEHRNETAVTLSADFWSAMLWDIEKLDTDYFAAITADTFAGLSGFNLYWASAEQIAKIPPASFSKMTEEQFLKFSLYDTNNPNYGKDGIAQSIKGITAEQIRHIPPRAFSQMTARMLLQLSPQALSAITPAQMGGLGWAFGNQNLEAIEFLNAYRRTHLDQPTPVLSATFWSTWFWGIETINKDYLRAMTPEAFAGMSPINLRAVPHDQLAAIPADCFAVLSLEQLEAFTREIWPHSLIGITGAQLAKIPAQLFAQVSKDVINALTPSQLAALTYEQVAALSVDTFAQLNTNQLMQLNAIAVKGVTVAQLTARYGEHPEYIKTNTGRRLFAGAA